MRSLLTLLFLFAFSVHALAQCDDGETAIKVGYPQDDEATVRQRFVTSLAEMVNARLQGKACIEPIASTESYADDLAIAALQAGSIQMAVPALEKLTVLAPRLIVFSLPFAFRDDLAFNRFLASPIYPRMLEPLSQAGLTTLGQLHTGFAQFAGSRPIHEPSDVAGMRFRRAGAPDPASRPDLLSASVAEVKDSDFAKALSAKQIEAVTGRWSFLASNKVDMLLDGATETNHRYEGFTAVVSRQWWDGLEAELREAVSKVASETMAKVNGEALAVERAALFSIIRRGGAVRALTDKQREAWLAQLAPMWERVQADTELILAIRRVNAVP